MPAVAGPAQAHEAMRGAPRWVTREAGPDKAFDRSAGLAISPDGSVVFVAGSSDGVFVVGALDARTGARRWSVRTPGPGGHQAFADDLAVAPDGNRLFVTG